LPLDLESEQLGELTSLGRRARPSVPVDMDTWLKKKEAFESGDVPPPPEDEGKAAVGCFPGHFPGPVVVVARILPSSRLNAGVRFPVTWVVILVGGSPREGRRDRQGRQTINNGHKQRKLSGHSKVLHDEFRCRLCRWNRGHI